MGLFNTIPVRSSFNQYIFFEAYYVDIHGVVYCNCELGCFSCSVGVRHKRENFEREVYSGGL